MRDARKVGLGLAALAATAACAVWFGLPGPAAAGAPEEAPAYIGSATCKKCHFKQWKSWKETKMARAFDTLKPGAAKEAKVKAGLDPEKDYTADAKCLACHTTGYGQPGGYPAAGAAADEKLRAAREGVQCESCHGPGSLYDPYMKKHEKAGFDRAEAVNLGLAVADEKSCLSCHRGGPDGSPTMAAGETFDAAAALKKEGAIHVHVKKK